MPFYRYGTFYWLNLFFLSYTLKEADLILGGDEGKECTYGKGYVKRQAIFSCLTCTPDGNAGVCTACSLVCHDGHEVYLSSVISFGFSLLISLLIHGIYTYDNDVYVYLACSDKFVIFGCVLYLLSSHTF